MNTAPGLAPPIPPARGLDLEYETEGSFLLFLLIFMCHDNVFFSTVYNPLTVLNYLLLILLVHVQLVY